MTCQVQAETTKATFSVAFCPPVSMIVSMKGKTPMMMTSHVQTISKCFANILASFNDKDLNTLPTCIAAHVPDPKHTKSMQSSARLTQACGTIFGRFWRVS